MSALLTLSWIIVITIWPIGGECHLKGGFWRGATWTSASGRCTGYQTAKVNRAAFLRIKDIRIFNVPPNQYNTPSGKQSLCVLRPNGHAPQMEFGVGWNNPIGSFNGAVWLRNVQIVWGQRSIEIVGGYPSLELCRSCAPNITKISKNIQASRPIVGIENNVRSCPFLAHDSSKLFSCINLGVIGNSVLLPNKVATYDSSQKEKTREYSQPESVSSNGPCPLCYIIAGGILFCSGIWISWRAIFHFIYRKGSSLGCLAIECLGLIVMDAGLVLIVLSYFI